MLHFLAQTEEFIQNVRKKIGSFTGSVSAVYKVPCWGIHNSQYMKNNWTQDRAVASIYSWGGGGGGGGPKISE